MDAKRCEQQLYQNRAPALGLEMLGFPVEVLPKVITKKHDSLRGAFVFCVPPGIGSYISLFTRQPDINGYSVFYFFTDFVLFSARADENDKQARCFVNGDYRLTTATALLLGA